MSVHSHAASHTTNNASRLKFSLLVIPVIILCLMLGKWQLHRYNFKKALLTTYQQHLIAPPIPFSTIASTNANLQFLNVSTQGYYRNDLNMLVQNQFYHDQIGYEVLTPLQIPGLNKLLIVDRGWVKAESNQKPPIIAPISAEQRINGYIKLLNEYQFTVGKNILSTNVTPIVMQKISVAEISQLTQQKYYPFILRLAPNQANGFIRDWIITTVLPQRHMAYAVQWFALAFTLSIAFLFFCRHKNWEDKNDTINTES